jgi:threonine 3-dehydrogenase
MKALRKTQAGQGLVLETVRVPQVGPGDVLVRGKAASICGTDLHIFGWDSWSRRRVKPPVTLGHEFCGTVEHTGEEVTVFTLGDRVSAEMHLCCGRCHQYRAGVAHICQNLRILGIDRDGAFAEFVKIPASNVWKLDGTIPEEYGAILDPLGNAVHAVLSGPITGQTVLVTGCGPIGLLSIAVAKACGSSTIFATETNEYRREPARKMGADAVLRPGEGDAVGRIRADTDGAGIDVLLEMSRKPRAIQQGLRPCVQEVGRRSWVSRPNRLRSISGTA